MIHTVAISSRVQAQGQLTQTLPDGRLLMGIGGRTVAGLTCMKEVRNVSGLKSVLGGALIGLSLLIGNVPQASAETLLNVSYDPTRELYREFNEAWPVLVDWLVSDQEGLDRAKAGISKYFWERCKALGQQRLEAGYPPRDARPWYSRISTRNQREGGWNRVSGGYWH